MRLMIVAIALSALAGALGAGHAAPGEMQHQKLLGAGSTAAHSVQR